MIAALPMYDRPETVKANDTLWRLIQQKLGFGPETLTRDVDLWAIWTAPDLVFAQTCNLPYRTNLHGKVQLIGSPDYQLPGCPPGYYNSVLVARAEDHRSIEDLLTSRVVINQDHSQSGYGALWFHAADLGLQPHVACESGAHVISARMVADSEADLACIDAMTWRLIKRHDPFAGNLREVERTYPTPATPFICAVDQDANKIRDAAQAVIADLDASTRETLSLYGLVPVDEHAFLSLATPPAVIAQADVG